MTLKEQLRERNMGSARLRRNRCSALVNKYIEHISARRFLGTLITAKAAGAIRTQLKLLLAVCILVSGFSARPAGADEYDTLNFVLGGTVASDSNLFRRPDSLGPQSEIISTGYVGLRVDKPYAQQRFQLSATETTARYEKFSYLNFDATSYRGAWLWHLTPRVSGTLSAERTEALAPFDETLGAQRNVRTSDNRIFNLDALIFGGWHMLLGASWLKQASEQAFQFQPDFRSVRKELGIRYVARSGSSVTATGRSTDGEYLHSVFDPANSGIDGFREDEIEFGANWLSSGNSTVSGRLAWVKRRHDNFSQRDFSGLAGDLGYVWTPAGKLSFAFSAGQNIRPFQDLFSNYVVERALSFTPTWRIGERTAVRMRLEQVQSDFRGGTVARPGGTRSDTARTALIGADWLPLRSVTLGATLQHQRRSSNESLANYDATIASVSASLMF